jgi:predicted Rossmann fold flavoprotein
MYKLIVIGGGPAGMLGAATAGKNGLKVALLEKNEALGKKLYITGSGRCNVTNSGVIEDFPRSVVTNGKFMYSAFTAFSNLQLINLLTSLGVKVKVERNNRVFPASDRSADIVRALHEHLLKNQVEIRLNTGVREILVKDCQVCGVFLKDGSLMKGNRVILAVGGASYRQTGSTGDGYRMAKKLGHNIIEPRPALVPLMTAEKWIKDLQGITLENIRVQALTGRRIAEQQGEMLFTHFGLSGPAILNLSSYLSRHSKFPVKITIDLLPLQSLEQVEDTLRRCLKQNGGKHLKNALGGLLPQKMSPVIFEIADLEPRKLVSQVTRGDINLLARILKGLTVTVTGTRPLNEAIITSGGIDTKEINPSTLESKIIRGLYFAGEVIDVDALTGGYNLQIAFSTGYLSGLSASM